VLSRLGGGRAAAWLLVAAFGVLGTFAVLRSNAVNHPDAGHRAQSAPGARMVPLPGAIPLAALPAPLPDESATGGSPAGELTIIDPPAPASAPASAPPGPSGIPGIPFAAYQHARQVLAVSSPDCHLGWPVLAAIGRAESGHAQGGRVDAHGHTIGRILGPRLDGSTGLPRVSDTDKGLLDGDPTWDRAVGPMQIVPSVWRRYSVDSDADGRADPNNIFDAALTAGRYLCAGGMDLGNQEQERTALYRYNESDSFVSAVRSWASGYGQGVASVPLVVPPPAPVPFAVDAPPVDTRAPVRAAPLLERPRRPTAPHRAASRRPAVPTARAARPTTEPESATTSHSSGVPLMPRGQPNVVVPPAPGTRVSAGAPSDRVYSQVPDTAVPTTAGPTPTAQPSTATTSAPTTATIRVRPVPASELPPFTSTAEATPSN
jgi:hypothetical protein